MTQLRGPVEFEIDGVRYEHTLLLATKGAEIASFILSAALPAIAEASDGGEDFEPAELLKVAGAVLVRDHDKLMRFCKDFAKSTVVVEDEKRIPLDRVFDFHFQGRFKSLGQFAFECAKANFSDFFDGRSGLGVRK